MSRPTLARRRCGVSTVIAHAIPILKGQRLQRFIDHFLDLKFKLYMLAEVDVPTYASSKEMWGLNRDRPRDTPHGFTTQLSEEVTLIVKSRAIWESIMNLVYW